MVYNRLPVVVIISEKLGNEAALNSVIAQLRRGQRFAQQLVFCIALRLHYPEVISRSALKVDLYGSPVSLLDTNVNYNIRRKIDQNIINHFVDPSRIQVRSSPFTFIARRGAEGGRRPATLNTVGLREKEVPTISCRLQFITRAREA